MAANESKQFELFPKGNHDDLFDHCAWEMTTSVELALKVVTVGNTSGRDIDKFVKIRSDGGPA